MLIAARIMTGTLRTEVPAKVPRRRTAISRADEQTANRNCTTSRYIGYSLSAKTNTPRTTIDPHHSITSPRTTIPTAKFFLILRKQSLTERNGKDGIGGGRNSGILKGQGNTEKGRKKE
jgi:hypothetical protein